MDTADEYEAEAAGVGETTGVCEGPALAELTTGVLADRGAGEGGGGSLEVVLSGCLSL